MADKEKITKEMVGKVKEGIKVEDLAGVGPTTANKLKEAGYSSLEQLAIASPAELCEVAEIGEGTADKIIKAARDALDMGFETADKVLERRKIVERLTTGSKELDKLIGGGVETQAITEAFGRFSSGKSQLAFQLAVNCILPKDKGGFEGGCIFVDTENTFRPERIIQIAEEAGLDTQEVLKNILVARAYNSAHQMILVEKAQEQIEKHNIRLIIIDSLTSLFRAEFIGRGTLADRQQKLNQHIHALLKLANLHNIAVYVTNQVMSRPDILFGNPYEAIGGNIVGHGSTYRIYLRKGAGEKRIARLIDSPCLPEAEAVFTVTEKGVGD